MKRRFFLFYLSTLITGCISNLKTDTNTSLAPPLELPKKLRLSITDVKGIEELKNKYEQFRIVLEEILATKIEFLPVDNYFTAAAALKANQVDLVWAGPSEYIVIRARTNAIPIVAIKRVNYYTVIVVHRDSGIKVLKDLKGKTIDFENNGSTSTHLGGIKMLMEVGLNPRSDFKSIMSNNDSLNPLITKVADACSRNPYRYQYALKTDGLSAADFPIIAQGKPLPNDLFIVGSHIQPEIANKIHNLMLKSQAQIIQSVLSVDDLATKFQGATLTTANDQDYDVIREVYKAMGQGEFLE